MTDKTIHTVLSWTAKENERTNRAYAEWLKSGKTGTKNRYMKEIILKEAERNETQ